MSDEIQPDAGAEPDAGIAAQIEVLDGSDDAAQRPPDTLGRIAREHQHSPDQLPYEPAKGPHNPPLVTVFGGGIAGLTAAHELVQRGFVVQLVEPAGDDEQQYGCDVGGLARSGSARIRESARVYRELYHDGITLNTAPANLSTRMPPHPEYKPPEYDLERVAREFHDVMGEVRGVIHSLRTLPLQRVQRRFPISETINYSRLRTQALDVEAIVHSFQSAGDATPPQVADFVRDLDLADHKDWHGELQLLRGALDERFFNPTKLNRICTKLIQAYTEYAIDLARSLARLGEHTGQLLELHWNSVDPEPIDEGASPEIKRARARHDAMSEIGRREILHVHVRGYARGLATPEANTRFARMFSEVARAWIGEQIHMAVSGHDDADPGLKATANTALKRLQEHLPKYVPVTPAHCELDLRSIGAHLHMAGNAEPGEFPDDDSRIWAYVDFEIIEHVLDTEHGFRFFPAHYRHVFDTMQRTPKLDDQQQETNGTVLDRLKQPPPVRLGARGLPDYQSADRSRTQSVEVMRQQARWYIENMGFGLRDQLKMQTQFLKFMTSGKSRRQRYSAMSWMEFVDGKSEFDKPNPEAALEGSNYAKRADAMIRHVPQLLVAMSATETDALTNGATSVQLILDSLFTGGDKAGDRMLDGPTSKTWLQPWKQFLEHQGVRFFRGRLEGVQFDGEELVPVVGGDDMGRPLPDDPLDVFIDETGSRHRRLLPGESADNPAAPGPAEPTPDFYVLALPYEQATRVLWDVDGLQSTHNRMQELLGKLDTQHFQTLDAESANTQFAALVSDVGSLGWIESLKAEIKHCVALVKSSAAAKGSDPGGLFYRNQLALGLTPAELDLFHVEHFDEFTKDMEKLRDAADRVTTRPGIGAVISSTRAALDKLPQALPNRRLVETSLRRVIRHAWRSRYLPNPLVRAEDETFQAINSFSGENGILYAALYVERLTSKLTTWAERLHQWRSNQLGRYEDDLAQLLVFDRKAGRRDRFGQLLPPNGDPMHVPRDNWGLPQPRFQFPLRDMIGMQFYFSELVRPAHGHFILPESAWGVSGISQASIWQTRPSLAYGYLGQLSVVVGNPYAPYEYDGGFQAKTAFESGPDEIARFMWEQIVETSTESYAHSVLPPRYYYIDDGVTFKEGDEGGIDTNSKMLMINLPGQFEHRPGLVTHLDGHQEVQSRVSNRRWVVAGNHTATTTRLSTMESANESGRQAVNGILRKLLETREPELYNRGGHFLGDFCSIWDPQDHEIPDLEPFKRLDEDLYARNMPHFLDILGIPEAIAAMPNREDPNATPVFNLATLIEQSRHRTAMDWDFLRSAGQGAGFVGADRFVSQLQRTAEHVQRLIDAMGSAGNSSNGSG